MDFGKIFQSVTGSALALVLGQPAYAQAQTVNAMPDFIKAAPRYAQCIAKEAIHFMSPSDHGKIAGEYTDNEAGGKILDFRNEGKEEYLSIFWNSNPNRVSPTWEIAYRTEKPNFSLQEMAEVSGIFGAQVGNLKDASATKQAGGKYLKVEPSNVTVLYDIIKKNCDLNT